MVTAYDVLYTLVSRNEGQTGEDTVSDQRLQGSKLNITSYASWSIFALQYDLHHNNYFQRGATRIESRARHPINKPNN